MNQDILRRQGHRLLQLGIVLLLFTSFEGFIVQNFAAPNLGRSVHTLSALTGILLIAFGLLWSRLLLGAAASQIAFWCLVYSSLAIIAAFLMGAIWSAGNTVMPQAAGAARGTAAQETAITFIAYSSAPTGIIAFALALWGLRRMPGDAAR